MLYEHFEKLCHSSNFKTRAFRFICASKGAQEIFLGVLIGEKYPYVIESLQHLSLVLN